MSDITFDTCECGSVVVSSAQSVTDEIARLRALNAELVEALKGVVRVADRATVEFDAARAAIAKAEKEGA